MHADKTRPTDRPKHTQYTISLSNVPYEISIPHTRMYSTYIHTLSTRGWAWSMPRCVVERHWEIGKCVFCSLARSTNNRHHRTEGWGGGQNGTEGRWCDDNSMCRRKGDRDSEEKGRRIHRILMMMMMMTTMRTLSNKRERDKTIAKQSTICSIIMMMMMLWTLMIHKPKSMGVASMLRIICFERVCKMFCTCFGDYAHQLYQDEFFHTEKE